MGGIISSARFYLVLAVASAYADKIIGTRKTLSQMGTDDKAKKPISFLEHECNIKFKHFSGLVPYKTVLGIIDFDS